MAHKRIFPVDLEAHFREPVEEEFPVYPEPPDRPRKLVLEDELKDAAYVRGLNQFVDDMSKHVRSLQEEEAAVMSTFNSKLKEQASREATNNQPKSKNDPADPAKDEFQKAISGLRKSRRAFKGIIHDALIERQKFFDSYKYSLDDLHDIHARYRKLKLSDKSTPLPYSYGREFNAFFGLLISLQIFIYLIAFAIYTFSDNTLGNNGDTLRADDWYSYFIHILIIVVFGFGYLSVFLQKYMYSAAAFNFFITAFAFQWALINLVLWENVRYNPTSFSRVPLTIRILIETAYVAGGVSVTLGIIIGKATIVELLLVAFWEVIFFCLNRYIVIDLLNIIDPGGAIYIHTFGAFFGIGVSWLLSLPYSEVLNSSSDSGKKLLTNSYMGDFMSLIGTVFIWALFPSWNTALAPDGTQYRVIINTVIALCGSAVVAALASRTFRGRNYHVKDVQLASLAGGIAIGSAHSTIISPGAALIVGSVAGLVTVVGFIFARKWMEGKSPVKIFDTRGAIILHGISGLMGGLGSVIACGGTSNGNFYGQSSSSIFPRPLPEQGGYQGAGIVITVGIALVSGVVAGFTIWFLRRMITYHTIDTLYSDKREFHVRVGYPEFEFKEP